MPFGGKILGVYLKFVRQERQGDDGFYRRKRIVRGRPVKRKIVVRLKLNCWFIGNESDFSPAFVLCRTDSVWGLSASCGCEWSFLPPRIGNLQGQILFFGIAFLILQGDERRYALEIENIGGVGQV